MRTSIVMLFALSVAVGCGSKTVTAPTTVAVANVPESAPTELPPFPSELKEPAPPQAIVKEKDLSKLPAAELSTLASQSARRKDIETAIAAEYWAVKAGGGDLYDLAGYYLKAKKQDAAFYWLAQAAVKQGLDLTKVTGNADLKEVWEEPLYTETVFPFLVKCSRYYAAHGSPNVVTTTPGSFDKSKPSPIIVFLHGHGSRPADILGTDKPDLAKATGLPVIAVSGSIPLGPERYTWAVDAVKDAQRVADALKSQSDRVTDSPGKVVVVGFDEGAQVALELAARDPATFAGAIAISPGAEFKLDGVKPSKTTRFVVVMGTRETWNRDVVKKDREFLAAAGVPVLNVDIPNGEHVLPPDLATLLPKWVKFVLEGN